MQRPCDFCGVEYEAKRPSSRFCGVNCRNRNAKAPVSRPAPVGELDLEVPVLVVTLRRELDEAGVLDTSLGCQAVELATRMSSPRELNVASLSKELRAVTSAALGERKVAADPIDELRAARDRKRAAATG